MDDKIKDADYKEVDKKIKNIRGKALYFSTSQVANILEQPDSKIRYYTTVFNDILNIEISNKQRRYTEQDIDKLRFIIKLKNEGLTIKQISEYSENVDFEGEDGKIQIKESNPLAIKTLAAALLEEQNNQLQNFKSDLMHEISDKMKEQLNLINTQNEKTIEKIREDVSITVDQTVSERLNSSLTDFNENLNTKLDTNINSMKSEIALDSENRSKQAKEIAEKIDNFDKISKNINENQTETLKKLVELTDTATRMEKRKRDNEIKKESSIWNRFFKRKSND